jgi:hypothetical protein
VCFVLEIQPPNNEKEMRDNDNGKRNPITLSMRQAQDSEGTQALGRTN